MNRFIVQVNMPLEDYGELTGRTERCSIFQLQLSIWGGINTPFWENVTHVTDHSRFKVHM